MNTFNKTDQAFNFILYGTGRSGSNLLKSLLNQIESVKCYGEIVGKPHVKNQLGLKSEADFKAKNFQSINDIVKLSIYSKDFETHQYVGMKFFYFHSRFVQKLCKDDNPVLKHLSENVKIIYSNRTNMVKKTFSRLIAQHKKVFYVRDNAEEISDKIHVPIDEISATINSDKLTRDYLFDQIKPEPHNLCTINYEDDLTGMEKIQDAMERLQLFFYPEREPYPIDEIWTTNKTPLKNNWREHISNFDELDQHYKQDAEIRGMLNEV